MAYYFSQIRIRCHEFCPTLENLETNSTGYERVQQVKGIWRQIAKIIDCLLFGLQFPVAPVQKLCMMPRRVAESHPQKTLIIYRRRTLQGWHASQALLHSLRMHFAVNRSTKAWHMNTPNEN